MGWLSTNITHDIRSEILGPFSLLRGRKGISGLRLLAGFGTLLPSNVFLFSHNDSRKAETRICVSAVAVFISSAKTKGPEVLSTSDQAATNRESGTVSSSVI